MGIKSPFLVLLGRMMILKSELLMQEKLTSQENHRVPLLGTIRTQVSIGRKANLDYSGG